MKDPKASEIIKNSCCGQLLDIPVYQITKKVSLLEDKIVFLEHQLDNAINEISRLKK